MAHSKSTQALTREQLANLLEVTPAEISEASQNNQLCKGYPIAEWTEVSSRGEVVAYHVPDDILTKIASNMASSRLKQVSKKLDEANSNNGLIKIINGFLKMMIGLLKIIPTGVKMGFIKPKRIDVSHLRDQKKVDNSVSYTLGSKEKDK